MERWMIIERARGLYAEWAFRYLQRENRLAPTWEELPSLMQADYMEEAQKGADGVEPDLLDDWVSMIAEILKMCHKGDLRYAGRFSDEWTSHAAELVGRYRRREDWQGLL